MAYVYLISGKNGALAVAHNHRHYIVGFNRETTARRVLNTLPPTSPKLQLEVSAVEDITHDINFGLQQLGALDATTKVAGVTVATNAKLTVTKCPDCRPDDFSVSAIGRDEFLMYPFEKCLGVVLQNDMYAEDAGSYVFLANVIDPCESSWELFVQKLKS
jgi:hypothetical protein